MYSLANWINEPGDGLVYKPVDCTQCSQMQWAASLVKGRCKSTLLVVLLVLVVLVALVVPAF